MVPCASHDAPCPTRDGATLKFRICSALCPGKRGFWGAEDQSSPFISLPHGAGLGAHGHGIDFFSREKMPHVPCPCAPSQRGGQLFPLCPGTRGSWGAEDEFSPFIPQGPYLPHEAGESQGACPSSRHLPQWPTPRVPDSSSASTPSWSCVALQLPRALHRESVRMALPTPHNASMTPSPPVSRARVNVTR